MSDPPRLSRQQIQKFVGNDPQAIRTIERLIEVAGEETPGTVTDVELVAEAALARVQALTQEIQAITSAFERFAPAVAREVPEDAAEPRRVLTMDELADVDAPAPAEGDLLQYIGGQWVPITGATGSFLSDGAAETITVTNGVITAIV